MSKLYNSVAASCHGKKNIYIYIEIRQCIRSKKIEVYLKCCSVFNFTKQENHFVFECQILNTRINEKVKIVLWEFDKKNEESENLNEYYN